MTFPGTGATPHTHGGSREGSHGGSHGGSREGLHGGSLEAGLLISRARTAARSGDLDTALRLLHNARESLRDAAGEEERDVLDLLARVHAQRGELTRAAEYWRNVQQRHPGDPAATAGLARIERLGRRGPGAALARHRAGTALACAMCTVAVLTAGAVVWTDHVGVQPQPPRATRADDAERRARLEAERTAARARQQAREAARRAAAADALAHALRLPGMRPEVHGASVEVVFTHGLFSQGAQLTPAGAGRLAALGEQLASRTARVEIYGHTASVPGAPRSGGSVTALWRALVAARELSAASGKPLTEFRTASADQRAAPYEAHALNRTVTVVLTPT